MKKKNSTVLSAMKKENSTVLSAIWPRNQGIHYARTHDSPLEEAFATCWDWLNHDDFQNGSNPTLLEALIGPCTNKEYRNAATLIQWLGSPVGQSFLKKVNDTAQKA